MGKLKANAFGLHDMLGNAWEWCSDWYGEYDSALATDPSVPADGTRRVLRGGSWYGRARDTRSAVRNNYKPGYRVDFTGLRVSRGRNSSGNK